MRIIIAILFSFASLSVIGQATKLDSTVIYQTKSIYNQAGLYIGKDSFHTKQVRYLVCGDTTYAIDDTLIARFPVQFITSDSVSADITEVNVTNYLTGGGSSGVVTVGIDTSGTVGVATKYDVKDFQTGSQVRDSIGTIDSDHDGVADDADLLDGETGSYYLNRANHYGNQDTLTITGLGEFTEDRIGSKIIAGSGMSKSYNDSTGELTLSSTVTGSITEVSVTDYLTGGGTSGTVTIGIDTSGTVGVATKYDVGTKIDGSGNTHYVPKFSDGNTLTDSRIYDDGDNNVIQIGNGTTKVNIDYVDGKAVNIANNGAYHTTIKGVSTGSTQNGTIITHNIDDEMVLIGGSYDGYYIDLGGSGYSTISTATEGVFINKINTSSAESNLLTVKNDGKVGIGGVTEPTQTLEVNGQIKAKINGITPTRVIGMDAQGVIGGITEGFGINVNTDTLLIDSSKIATQYDIKDFQTGLQVRDSIGTLDSNHDGNADNASKLEGQGGSYYLSRTNHTGTQDTTTINGLGEFVEDRAGAKIVAGTGITTSYNDATGETTINATGSGTGDITAVNVTDYLTGGGTSGDVTIGVDTTGTVGLATKYDLTTSSGATNLTYSGTSSPITLNSSSGSDVTITAGNTIKLTGTSTDMNISVDTDPLNAAFQRTLLGEHYWYFVAQGSTSIGGFGFNTNAVGTANSPTVSATNKYTKRIKLEYNQNTPATTNIASLRGNILVHPMSDGFIYSIKWGPTIGMSNTSKRAFTGLRNSTSAPTDVLPNTLTDVIGMGWNDALDNNVKIYHNDASGTATEIDLGSNFPVPSADRTNYYTLTIYVEAGGTTVNYKVIDETDGDVATGVITSNIPSTSTFLNFWNYASVGFASATTGWALFAAYGHTLD